MRNLRIDFFKRYKGEPRAFIEEEIEKRIEEYRLPKGRGARTSLALTIGCDNVRFQPYIIQIDESELNPREAMAVRLAERIARDALSVDGKFFEQPKAHFSEDEIVELVFACSIFNWGNKFNITMNMDTSDDSPYGSGLTYET